MIELDVMSLLEKRGKTKYWLAKQMGMTYQNLAKMVDKKTKSIRYSTIEALCQVLECQPNDLFKIDFDEPETPGKEL